MKKNLNIIDRIHLLNMLPKEGNAVTIRLLRQLKMRLSFSDEDIKELEIVTKGANITWNQEKDKGKEIEFGPTMLKLVKDTLEKLDKDKKLIETQLDVYDKFMDIEEKKHEEA